MVKLISFIVLTHFFQGNQVTYFFKLNHQYFFTVFSNEKRGCQTQVLTKQLSGCREYGLSVLLHEVEVWRSYAYRTCQSNE